MNDHIDMQIELIRFSERIPNKIEFFHWPMEEYRWQISLQSEFQK